MTTLGQFFARPPSRRPVPTVGRHTAAPAPPAVLNRLADVLDRRQAPRDGERGRLRMAERRMMVAAGRLRVLRAASRRERLSRWQRAAVAVVGLGLLAGFLLIGLLAVLYLGPGPLLVVPLVLVLAAVVVLARRTRGRAAPERVRGVDEAAAEVAAAETAVRRGRARIRRARAEASAWCERHGVPADAAALRGLARRTERRRRHPAEGRRYPAVTGR